MTDSQIIVGILQNDEWVWRYIYRTMKTGVVSTIFKPNLLTRADMDDLFQEACLILMRKVKEDQFVVLCNRGVFNFLIKAVEFLTNNYVRKMKPVYRRICWETHTLSRRIREILTCRQRKSSVLRMSF